MSSVRLGVLLLSVLAVSRPAFCAGTLLKHRDPWQIRLQGHESFSTDAIRHGLLTDAQFHRGRRSDCDEATFRSILRDRLLEGFRSNGFPEARIEVTQDAASHGVTVTIIEGPEYHWGDVRVESPAGSNAAFLTTFFQKWKDASFRESRRGRLSGWSVDSLVSTHSGATKHINELVAAVAQQDGLCQFESAVRIEQDLASHAVVPIVTILNPGYRPRISEIHLHGLQRFPHDAVSNTLSDLPGQRYSAELQEQVQRRLLDSGRFLHVRSWMDTAFDADHAVPLHVEVREYDRSPEFHVPLSDAEEAMRKLALWLNGWKDRDEDLEISLTMDREATDELSAVTGGTQESATEGQESGIPAATGPFYEQLLGINRPDRVELRFVMSPTDGVLGDLQTTPRDGSPPSHESLAVLRRSIELADWTRREKWSRPMELQGAIQVLAFNGLPSTAETGHRGAFKFWYGFNTRLRSPLTTWVTADAAAIIDLIYSDSSPATATRTDGITTVTCSAGILRIDQDTGRLIRADIHGETFRLTVESGHGRLLAAAERTMAATAAFSDAGVPDRPWSSLAAYMAPRIRRALEDTHVAAAPLIERVLLNSESIDQAAQAIADRFGRRAFAIPHASDGKNFPVADDWFLQTAAMAAPAGSTADQLWMLVRDARERHDNSSLADFVYQIVQNPEHGPLDCLTAAFLVASIRPQIANIGLQRMDAASFVRDVEPYLAEPNLYAEVLYALIRSAQAMTDDESELLALAVESITARKAADGQPATSGTNCRPLLAVIRSQRDAEPEDVLRSLLPLIWEGGLRAYVESILTIMATPSGAVAGNIHSVSQPRTPPAPEPAKNATPDRSLLLKPLQLDLPSGSGSLIEYTPQSLPFGTPQQQPSTD